MLVLGQGDAAERCAGANAHLREWGVTGAKRPAALLRILERHLCRDQSELREAIQSFHASRREIRQRIEITHFTGNLAFEWRGVKAREMANPGFPALDSPPQPFPAAADGGKGSNSGDDDAVVCHDSLSYEHSGAVLFQILFEMRQGARRHGTDEHLTQHVVCEPATES